MDENDFGTRYLQKMRDLTRKGAHLARTNDLLAGIKAKLPQLEELLARIEDRSGEEDGIYRFYHQSFKVFDLQELTLAGFKLNEEIGGETLSSRIYHLTSQARNPLIRLRFGISISLWRQSNFSFNKNFSVSADSWMLNL